MSRSSIIATSWQSAWGTVGTQSMKPSPHIEGLGSWAGKMDDRMCFLAFQQTDMVFCECVNKVYSVGSPSFDMMDVYHVYYNGYSPQLVFGYGQAWGGYVGNPAAATLSLRFGGVDFGTMRVLTSGATSVEWYADIPESFPAGEHRFEIYSVSDHTMHSQIDIYRWWLALLPARL